MSEEKDSENIKEKSSSSSIRGLSINLLYLDEFAFVDDAETFYTATYPVVTSGKDSKVIITSTANGVGNMFHKIYESAIHDQSEYKSFTINWYDVPGRDEAWKKETIANTSEAQFEQEYGNSFLGTGNTLINSNTLLGLKAWDAEWYKDGFSVYQKPVEDHTYICTVDVAKGRGMDFSTFTMFDVTASPFEQVAVYRNSMISPMLFPDIINKYAKAYNTALVIIENNAEGSMVASQLHYDIEYDNVFTQGMTKAEDIGVTMTKKIKRIGCSTLKEILEENRLNLIDRSTITELMTFINKGMSFEADRGYHDDMVMNCVLFSGSRIGTDGFGYAPDDDGRADPCDDAHRYDGRFLYLPKRSQRTGWWIYRRTDRFDRCCDAVYGQRLCVDFCTFEVSISRRHWRRRSYGRADRHRFLVRRQAVPDI